MTIKLEINNNIYSNIFNYKLLYKKISDPINSDNPCGLSIEYDNNYLMLQTKLMPQQDVQYGDFVNKPNEKNWPEIENDCKQLLNVSKDITVVIWLIRSRTQRAGAKGFLEGLYALYKLLKTYPNEIHPQLEIENFHDPAVRANAIEALTDPEGLLQDLRSIVLVSNTFFRLSVKDVDKAYTPSALPIKETESVKAQLIDLVNKKNESVISLLKSHDLLIKIIDWCSENLKDDSPNLEPLQRLLDPFKIAFMQDKGSTFEKNEYELEVDATSHNILNTTIEVQENSQDELNSESASSLNNFSPSHHTSETLDVLKEVLTEKNNYLKFQNISPNELTAQEKRELAKEKIQHLMIWFQENEPSSPVSLLLKQAHHLVGKNFLEVTSVIPAELLSSWAINNENE